MQYLTDGQLSSSISTIYSVSSQLPLGYSQPLVLLCYNTSNTNTETILVQIARHTGTTRTLARVTLDPNESCAIQGAFLEIAGGNVPGDALLGISTDSNVVDYVLYSISTGTPSWSITVYDAGGRVKTHPGLSLSCK